MSRIERPPVSRIKAKGSTAQSSRIALLEAELVDLRNIQRGASEDLESIRIAHAYSDSIIDTVREPLVVLDDALRVLSANRAFYTMFALEQDATVGSPIVSAGEGRLDTPLLKGFLDRIRAGDDLIEDYELVFDLPPLGQRTLLLNGRKIGGGAQENRKILVALEDVTERQRVSAALRMAKAEAEQASLAKSRFLAAASHDLRQPLQTMSLLHEILKRSVKGEQAHSIADKLGDTLAAMAGMLNALLDINQIEAGIVRASVSDFLLSELFEPLRAEFAYHAAAKGLDWRVVTSTAIVRSDRSLLEEILRNLLSNAVKYTTTGKILLGCRKHAGRIRIEIWDTGIGIPDEQLDAIFDEFHQVGNAARERSAGLGLGLFIARRLSEMLDHPIAVRSRLGAGSVFSIEVPVGLAVSPAQPESSPAGGGTVSRHGNILIVDDDPSVGDMLALLFKLDGHTSRVVRDAHDAQALLASGEIHPDIILADYNLPGGVTGLQFGQSVREVAHRDLPVIILTGDISIETLRKIAAAGFPQLNKPVKAQELLELIQTMLATQQPERSAEMPVAITRGPASEPDNAPSGCGATVFIVDDDPALCDALGRLLSSEGRKVETYGDAEAFLAAYRPDRAGCLMVDARLPGMSGLALLERLKAGGASLPAIMITGHGDVPTAVRAMEAGAVGFIEKPVAPATILAAIERALAEGRDQAEITSRRESAALRIAGLTPRERQVMDMVVAGNANKEIAYRLGINQRTVENHRATLMKKTGVASLAELIHLDFAARRAAAQDPPAD